MIKNSNIVMIRPTFDKNLELLTAAGEDLVNELSEKEYKIINLKSKFIKRDKVESILENLKDESDTIVIYYGHGSLDSSGEGMHGSPDEYVLDINNLDLVNKKIVFANACHCSKLHGKKSIENGTRIYIGYISEIWIPPLTKEYYHFKEIFNKPFKELFFNANSDTNDVEKKVRDEYWYWIEHWSKIDLRVSFVLDMNRKVFNINSN